MSVPISRTTSWSVACGPASACWARCWPSGARPVSRCRAAATLAIGLSTCTSRDCGRSEPISVSSGGTLSPAPPGFAARISIWAVRSEALSRERAMSWWPPPSRKALRRLRPVPASRKLSIWVTCSMRCGLGTPTLRIDGVERLFGVEHSVIPDRIEAATLMMAAAITRGNVTLTNVCPDHMTSVLDTLNEMGVRIVLGDRSLEVSIEGPLRPVECVALPYPAIPTDVQAQLTALLATVPGMSIVTDKVFPDRFLHAPELVRMGARIRREGNSAIVSGVDRLSGACVMASDLRASAALVLSGLAAHGPTVVRRIYHLDRGYEHLELKLRQLGADISRVRDEPANVPEALQVGQHAPVAPPHFEPTVKPNRNRLR